VSSKIKGKRSVRPFRLSVQSQRLTLRVRRALAHDSARRLRFNIMATRPLSSFDGARTADELLNLSTPMLAEIVLQYLKSWTHTVMQRDMLNRTYFIEIVEGTSRGLGISNAKPEYGTAQPAVSEALEEAWTWLVNQGMLMRVTGQPAEWYKITRAGEACLKRLAS
jgi:hypothetical protein